jgi:hypothetical protein
MKRLRMKLFPQARQFRVYMSFAHDAGRWHCRFHENNLAKSPITRRFVFNGAEKIYEAAKRAQGITDVVSRRALDEAIAKGCGGVWLRLSEKQFSTLLLASKRTPV